MKNITQLASPGVLLLCVTNAQAVDRTKNSTTNGVNLTTSWTGSIVPGTTDVGLWNSTSTVPNTAGNLPAQTADLSIAGLRVSNVGGTLNQNTMVGFRNGSSVNVLTLGASGIDMSTATQAFQVQARVVIAADQIWNVTQANTASSPMGFLNNEDLAFNCQTSAGTAPIPFDFGAHTVSTTGDGYITITSGYNLTNGTLDNGNNLTVIQSGGSKMTTLDATMNLKVSSGRLRLQSNSGVSPVAMTCAAPINVTGGSMQFRVGSGLSITNSSAITLNGGGLDFIIYNATTGPLTLSGPLTVNADAIWTVATDSNTGGGPLLGGVVSGNITGSGNLSYRNTSVNTGGYARLTGDNSGYSGTITLAGSTNNRSLMLASATAGSTAAKWAVETGNVLQVDGVDVQLGTLSGAGTVTNSSPANPASITVGSGVFSGVIKDGGTDPSFIPIALTKTGPGNLVLTGASTYTGLTTVSSGLLQTSPNQTGATNVVVADGAIFSVAPLVQDTTFTAQSLTLGSVTGATLDLSLGEHPNPAGAPIAVTNLTVNGNSKLRISGKNLTPGTFDAVQYTNATGLAGLALALPPRTNGSMGNSGTAVTVTISSIEQIKWNGNASSDWDIDPDGSGGTGTPNWLTTSGNVATRYIQASNGADVVTFDDSSTGGVGSERSVNLTAALAPAGIAVANNALNYTFTGSGSLGGLTSLVKSGTGSLTLGNTTANTYTGGTFIQGGSLKLGDGVTAGAGVVAGGIDIATDAKLVLNRPDDFSFTTPLSGTGTLEKAQANTVTVPVPAGTISRPLVFSGGKLVFAAGATLNGPLTGSGQLEGGATMLINGSDANSNTGMTSITAGQLQLSKPANTSAVGGDITISGAATMAILAEGQIPDTSNITFLGTSTNGIPGPATETIHNFLMNPADIGGQVVLSNNFTVNGTATINQGYFSIASGHTVNINSAVLTSANAILRIGGSSGNSILNVGAGGITASAGQVQVKFNTNAFDATLNLGGDVTTTGAVSFTNGAYTGANLNLINLIGARTFNVLTGTTTTIAPDIAGDGSLIKDGGGLLTLNSTVLATHTGGTTVNAGDLRVTGSLGGAVQVNANGILSGSGTLTGATTVAGTVAPGTTASGGLDSTGSVEFGPDSRYAFSISTWTGSTPGTNWDLITAANLNLTATPSNKLVIAISGTATGFTEAPKTFRIATSTNPIVGFNPGAVQITSALAGTGTWTIQQTGNDLELVYTPSDPYPNWATSKGLVDSNDDKPLDPDFDEETNLTEFALDGNPLSGTASGKVVSKLATIGGNRVLTLTLPVRAGAVFAGTTEKTATVDGAIYLIQAGPALAGWPVVVTEVAGADATALQTGLPTLSTGWTYRSFRAAGAVATDPRGFIRVKVTAP